MDVVSNLHSPAFPQVETKKERDGMYPVSNVMSAGGMSKLEFATLILMAGGQYQDKKHALLEAEGILELIGQERWAAINRHHAELQKEEDDNERQRQAANDKHAER